MPNEYLSLTEISKFYGVSSHQVGKWLTEIGLRSNGKPTSKAFVGGYVIQRPSTQPDTYYYVWHREKTVAAIDAMKDLKSA